ncbi:cobalt-precorrin 5A hydrolase [Phosphitispora fastidiosa]|uniref:cobalt-precorrin 5A hydrolase n=1 Tax=Phosphitispora fastidiosa TaxID=2837202 RepID=UPI001E4EC0AE|nr:cobalt-precorrin 5A hydrolase [Phosphitispora fastidiosa]MBU7007052.1 cobalt-precorrin 5A hydrolase [Phosphitispora fastidiosa]
MKVAVVAVTRDGAELARKIAGLLDEAGEYETVLYLPGRFSLLRITGKRQPYRKPLKELFGELFGRYDGILCIMALGIVVRLSAPHIRDKRSDPAVVVMDELGNNVISVLSGHLGGANALTLQTAQLLGANPVITTATDVQGLPAIEMVAAENGLVAEPLDLVKTINAAIVNKQQIVIYTEFPIDIAPTENITVRDFAEYSPSRREENRVVLVTNRAAASFPEGTLFLRPQNVCIGIGCRKGVSSAEVRQAILQALEETGRALTAVKLLASIDIKSEEQGLLEAAGEMDLPTEFYGRPELQEVHRARASELSFSEFVDQKIGVGGVCEPAAILGAGQASVILMPKKKFGKVTIAMAEGDWPLSE